MIARFSKITFFVVVFCFVFHLHSEDLEKNIQKIVVEAMEHVQLQLKQFVSKNKATEPENQAEVQAYKQFLEEHLGKYWTDVEQWCTNISDWKNLPQMNVWNKISELEEQIAQLQKEIEKLKAVSATS